VLPSGEPIGSREQAMLATPCREFSLARNGRYPYGNGEKPIGSRVQLAIWRSQGDLSPTLSGKYLYFLWFLHQGFPFKDIGDSRVKLRFRLEKEKTQVLTYVFFFHFSISISMATTP